MAEAMFIEIRGVQFANKGAQLMLAAIVERLNATIPCAKLVAEPRIGSYPQRAQYGLFQKFTARQAGPIGWLLEKMLHDRYHERFGVVAERSITVVLDASGFAIGDQWPLRRVKKHANAFERWRRQGKKVILLPQALGSFKNPAMRATASRALSCADLIFARDAQSYAYTAEILPGHRGLRQAGDFTNLLPPTSSRGIELGARPVAIVPNDKVLRYANGDAGYVRFLSACAKKLKEIGFNPFLLIHETKNDQDLCRQVASEAGGLRLLEEADPRLVKDIAARCEMMIGSRFHGLVNALSQGVPSVGTSWSHKYAALFADYGRPKWLVDPSSEVERGIRLIDEIAGNHDAERRFLLERSAILKSASENMWQTVESVLSGGCVARP